MSTSQTPEQQYTAAVGETYTVANFPGNRRVRVTAVRTVNGRRSASIFNGILVDWRFADMIDLNEDTVGPISLRFNDTVEYTVQEVLPTLYTVQFCGPEGAWQTMTTVEGDFAQARKVADFLTDMRAVAEVQILDEYYRVQYKGTGPSA